MQSCRIYVSRRVYLELISEGYLIECYLTSNREYEPKCIKVAKVIPFFRKWSYCPRCVHPIPKEWREQGICKAHSDEYEVLDATIAVGLYYTQNVINELGLRTNKLTDYILQLKHRKNIASLLAAAMAVIMRSGVYGISEKDIDILTFVPKHPVEYKIDEDTGEEYNQAEELARYLSRYLDRPVYQLIIKTTPLSLSGLSFRDRYEQCRKVYKLCTRTKDLVKGMRIVVVDDVRTTGATGNIIAELLKRAGAERVYLLVAGRATHLDTFKILLSSQKI